MAGIMRHVPSVLEGLELSPEGCSVEGVINSGTQFPGKYHNLVAITISVSYHVS